MRITRICVFMNMLFKKSYRRTKTADTTTMIKITHAPIDPPIVIGKGSDKLFGKMSAMVRILVQKKLNGYYFINQTDRHMN